MDRNGITDTTNVRGCPCTWLVKNERINDDSTKETEKGYFKNDRFMQKL